MTVYSTMFPLASRDVYLSPILRRKSAGVPRRKRAPIPPAPGPVVSRLDFNMPLPPSANNATVNLPGRGRGKSAAYLQWQKDAAWAVKGFGPKGRIEGRFTFTILVSSNMKGDVDGRIKLAQDLFVSLGIVPDDSRAWSAKAERSDAVGLGACVCILEAVA